jgi:hypothetical protein
MMLWPEMDCELMAIGTYFYDRTGRLPDVNPKFWSPIL